MACRLLFIIATVPDYCQIGVLAIGWVVMNIHVGTETDFNITEPALKEPYFSWINTFITIYWGVGILVTLFSTIALLISKKDNKIQYLLFLIPTLLLSIGVYSKLSYCIN